MVVGVVVGNEGKAVCIVEEETDVVVTVVMLVVATVVSVSVEEVGSVVIILVGVVVKLDGVKADKFVGIAVVVSVEVVVVGDVAIAEIYKATGINSHFKISIQIQPIDYKSLMLISDHKIS